MSWFFSIPLVICKDVINLDHNRFIPRYFQLIFHIRCLVLRCTNFTVENSSYNRRRINSLNTVQWYVLLPLVIVSIGRPAKQLDIKPFTSNLSLVNVVAALNAVFVSFIQIDCRSIASGSNLTPSQ